jgi:hypothetical protein
VTTVRLVLYLTPDVSPEKLRRGLLEQGLMPTISFKRHRFPPDVIRHAVWLYS